MLKWMFAFVGLALAPLVASGQSGKEVPATIRVSGEAMVTAKPDQADINIGVVTQAPSADDAAAQNAKETTAVLSSLRELLGQMADIKTLNYSLTPLQRFPPNGGTPTITGYSVSNTVHVRTENLAIVGKIIDTVTKSGANNIQGVQFTLRDDQSTRAQALRQASQQARANSDVLAAALGLHVVRIATVDATPPSIRPVDMVPLGARAAAVATPIEAGSVEVHASVVLTLEVAP